MCLLGLGLNLVGCHQILPLEPPWIDEDSGRADAAVHDHTLDGPIGIDRGIDISDLTPIPDQTSPEGGAPSYYEDFDKGLGALTQASSSCQVGQGKLTQQDKTVIGVCGTLYTPYDDYHVEVEIVMLERLQSTSIDEGAGIAVRVQDATPPPEVHPGLYACVLTPDGVSLSVAKCYPQSTPCDQVANKPAVVKLNTTYTLTAIVIGDTLTCEVQPLGVSLTHKMVGHSSGVVSLLTLGASATFDNLKVDPL